MQKKVIINPTKAEEGTYTLLVPADIKRALFTRCLGVRDGRLKVPFLITDTHLGRLISNIEYRVKSVSRWTNKEVNSLDEACEYLAKVADEIYAGEFWDMKVLKAEVMYGKDKVYGLVCPVAGKVQQIRQTLESVATIEVNEFKGVKKDNKSPEQAKTKTEKDPQ